MQPEQVWFTSAFRDTTLLNFLAVIWRTSLVQAGFRLGIRKMTLSFLVLPVEELALPWFPYCQIYPCVAHRLYRFTLPFGNIHVGFGTPTWVICACVELNDPIAGSDVEIQVGIAAKGALTSKWWLAYDNRPLYLTQRPFGVTPCLIYSSLNCPWGVIVQSCFFISRLPRNLMETTLSAKERGY